MLKTVEKMLAVPDCLQKVDPAAPDCDILVDSAVTVYPIHLDQWFSTPVLRAAFSSPGTLCAALSSLPMKRLIFVCNRLRSAVKQHVSIELY